MENLRNSRAQMIDHTLSMLRDILEDDMGKKRGSPRLEYFPQIMKDMECGILREVKESSGGGCLRQTCLRTV